MLSIKRHGQFVLSVDCCALVPNVWAAQTMIQAERPLAITEYRLDAVGYVRSRGES